MSSDSLQSTGGCASAGSVTMGGFCSPARPRPLHPKVIEPAPQKPAYVSAPLRMTGAWLAS